MEKLSDLFARHGSDKHTGDKTGHSYGPVYDEMFTPLQDKIHAVLEIGVLGGASLRAWRDFFEHCFVVGLDTHVEPREEWMISIYKCDATKADEVDHALGDRTFSLAVDDGSHWEQDQLKSFELMKHRLRPGGIWVIEDVQCQTTVEKLRDMGFEIIDLRPERDRFDDVLAVFRN